MLISHDGDRLTAISFVFTEPATCEKLLGSMSNLHSRLSLSLLCMTREAKERETGNEVAARHSYDVKQAPAFK